jgi:hypothetical protein
MKNLVILIAFTLSTSYSTFSQTPEACKLTYLLAGGGRNFQLEGNESYMMIDSLFTNLPNTKRKGYIWKFKNVHVPGLDYPVTFQVHQGLAGKAENGRRYFNTFTSEKYRTERLSRKIESEDFAIIIYVKQGRNHVLKTEEEAKIVKNYLLSIYG